MGWVRESRSHSHREPRAGYELVMTMDAERFRGLAGFRQGMRRFLAASESISRAAGVTAQQYQALLAIKAAESSQLAMKDLVQLMDRLETAGLAERRPSERDRRFVFVALTEAGDTLINDLAERHLEEMLRQEPQLRSSLNRLKRLQP
jgi:DNA-binding MarR family transcriptional regulator